MFGYLYGITLWNLFPLYMWATSKRLTVRRPLTSQTRRHLENTGQEVSSHSTGYTVAHTVKVKYLLVGWIIAVSAFLMGHCFPRSTEQFEGAHCHFIIGLFYTPGFKDGICMFLSPVSQQYYIPVIYVVFFWHRNVTLNCRFCTGLWISHRKS